MSSCAFVVSLHGAVEDGDTRVAYERATLRVPGVEAVKNELRVAGRTVLDVQEKG